MSIDQILLIIAAVCFALAGLNIQLTPRLSLGWLGLLAWVLTLLL